VLVAAERAKRTTPEVIQHLRAVVGDVPIIIGACALELGQAIGTHNARDFNRIPGLEVLSL